MSCGGDASTSQQTPLVRTPPRRWRRRILTLLLVVGMLALATLIGWDDRRMVTTQYDVDIRGSATLRIAQVADLHDAYLDEPLLREVRDANPDVIALTGDLVSASDRDLTHALGVAQQLAAIAPTYAVLGNHEADSPLRSEILKGMEESGIHILRNEQTTLTTGTDETVTIAGIDDPRTYRAAGERPPDTSRLVSSVLRGADTDAPRILLAHRPEELRDYSAAQADLVLSGHAHGGQVRIPGIGGLWAPHQGFFPRLTSGVHTDRGTVMVISRGLGDSAAPLRINNPPELVIIDVR